MSVEYKDYYKTLGVQRTATTEEIGKAYKKLAKKYHPDLNPNDKKAEERFREINEANEVLKDPEKRKMYDHLGPDWKNGQQFGGQNFRRPPGFENARFSYGSGGADFGGFSDFFETLFGGGMRGAQGGANPFGGAQFRTSYGGGNPFEGFAPHKGSDSNADITLTLEDAFRGGKKNVTLRGPSGVRSLEVNIPAGVKPGARIRLAGQGDSSPGGAAGDLYLKVHIAPDNRFTLDDADIIYDLALAPWEAVLGCKIRVPTLTGDVEIAIAPGAGSGKKLRLRGKGLGTGAAKGDQLVRISIAVPDTISDAERKLWQSLQDVSSFHPRA
jgi:curved DNA-binding protein